MKMTVTKVAHGAGVHPHTVRALTRRGLIKAQRDCNGWRRYAPEVIEQIKKLYAMTDERRPPEAA